MTDAVFYPRAYVLNGCPFCLKLRIFLTEAGLASKVTFIVSVGHDDVQNALFSHLKAAGLNATFPAVEFEPGLFQLGADDLIARFARDADVDMSALPLLDYYTDGVFKRYGEMFLELRRAKQGAPPSDA